MTALALGAAAVAISMAAGPIGTAAATEQSVIHLAVHNRADIPAADFERAQREVERIFEHAAVSITWTDATAPTRADEAGPPTGRRVTVWLVNITRDSKAGTSGCVLGLGLASTSTAYVFVNRLVAATLDLSVDLPTVLAHAIAHEVGHVLLPPGPHSRYGLMRGNLDFSVTNPARFTRDEAAALGRAARKQ